MIGESVAEIMEIGQSERIANGAKAEATAEDREVTYEDIQQAIVEDRAFSGKAGELLGTVVSFGAGFDAEAAHMGAKNAIDNNFLLTTILVAEAAFEVWKTACPEQWEYVYQWTVDYLHETKGGERAEIERGLANAHNAYEIVTSCLGRGIFRKAAAKVAATAVRQVNKVLAHLRKSVSAKEIKALRHLTKDRQE